jgi:hypothetical protein
MLKRTIIILSFVAFISTHAQQVYFCNSHTETGEPVDARNVWSIKPWGSLIYILFDNEGEAYETQLNYMFLDRYVDGDYKPFDSKAINIKEDATWFAYNYKFKEPGKYRVYLVNQNKKEVMSGSVTIQIESDYINNRQGANSLYYDGTKIKFCERVIAGQPINTFRKMSIAASDSMVTVFIDHQSAIQTSTMVVDIWEKPARSVEYDKFVESKKYALNPSWDYAFFKYKFDRPGYYKMNIYNTNEVLITTGYLHVVD